MGRMPLSRRMCHEASDLSHHKVIRNTSRAQHGLVINDLAYIFLLQFVACYLEGGFLLSFSSLLRISLPFFCHYMLITRVQKLVGASFVSTF